MLTTAMKMPEMVAAIVERMYRTMENDPQYLLMQDGGPVGRTAHVVIARLYGHDEQIDHEMRIDSATDVLLAHRPQRLPLSADDPATFGPAFDIVTYRLQSGFAQAGLAASVADSETLRWIGKHPNPHSFDWDFLALRYQRRQ